MARLSDTCLQSPDIPVAEKQVQQFKIFPLNQMCILKGCEGTAQWESTCLGCLRFWVQFTVLGEKTGHKLIFCDAEAGYREIPYIICIYYYLYTFIYA